MKANKQYNRFRHFGLDKIKMDFAIFAIAFNIGKLHNKTQNVSKNHKNPSLLTQNIYIFVIAVIFTQQNVTTTEFSHNTWQKAA